jgi:sugar (pentulose or hexulose) kinase
MAFLGIDLGTGGIRCLLVDESGAILADLSRPLREINLSSMAGHSEQDAEDWIAILDDVLCELFSTPSHRDVKAIGVDSTSGTVLPVSQAGKPLGYAFLHNDVRAQEQAERCVDVFAGSCSPTFSLPKILWMQQNLRLPEDTLFLHATDFLNAWLAGHTDLPTDSTNAMKSGLDLETGDWSSHMPNVNLPRVVPPGQVFEKLAKEHCARWGLSREVKLVSGATDSNAAFYASGAGLPGEWSTTIGTTLAIKGIAQHKIEDSQGRIYCHCHPDGYWLPGGASNAGGEILRDHANALCELSPVLRSTVPASLVYPSVRKGERLPFADPFFKPFFTGDKKEGTEYLLACLEGIAFVEYLSYELLERLGAEVGKHIYATGGAASSEIGLQIRADVLQKVLHVPAYPHSAMGAAILAAAGYHQKKVGDVSRDMVKMKKVVEPCSGMVSERVEKLSQFRDACSG